MRRAGALLAALAVLVGACSDDDSAEPDPDRRETTTTALIDRSGIALAPVPGETTTTIRETGSARLVGVVRGPQGPVPGATVRIERIVHGRELRRDVATGADGRFVLEGVPGGRYRVRAFAPPSLAQLEPELRFLADAQEHSFDLVVDDHSGLVVRSSAAPQAPTVGDPVNVVVQVAERQVDGDGIVRTVPLAGLPVQLTGLGRWVLRSESPGGSSGTTSTTFQSTSSTASARTDGNGRARFELQCVSAGQPGLAVRIPVAAPAPPPPAPGNTTPTTSGGTSTETIGLDLPACSTATTTTTSSPTTSSTSSTTSTTEDPDDE